MGGETRRVAAVDAFEFPVGARHRFAARHDALSPADIRLVEAAMRQWFRLVARHPKVKLGMPSLVVDDLWRELIRHTREYEAFCLVAFERLLPREPESAAIRSALLLATLGLARRDEATDRQPLPLLFRVDREVRAEGGHGYLADCGGRHNCYAFPGLLCLMHVGGVFDAGPGPSRALITAP